MRLTAENDRLKEELEQLREVIQIKDARMARIHPRRRPHYLPTDRSLAQTARVFLVTPETIACWMKRLEEDGPKALVQTHSPVNRFPEFVAYLVQQFKTLCPKMGKKKIADTLARAGLHLATTTVGRMLKTTAKPPAMPDRGSKREEAGRVVTAKRPNHVWHVDLTAVSTRAGYWASWLPCAVPQCWPFCWWVAVAEDHFSRRLMGITAFKGRPTSCQVRQFLGRTMAKVGVVPKYLICDKGSQFWCDGFKLWCRKRRIRPRFGAVGKHGSIAVVERLILTIKDSCARLILVPLRRKDFLNELKYFSQWYNEFRPHMTLDGRTPNEVYRQEPRPAHRAPRFEPRETWPRGSPCAKPQSLIKGRPGVNLLLQIDYHRGRKHQPIVTLRRAA